MILFYIYQYMYILSAVSCYQLFAKFFYTNKKFFLNKKSKPFVN